MIQINNRDPRPIYEQVRDSICRLIVSGGITADEKLPSVREMAASLAINPNTIQRAYRELEADGYIYTVPGKGAFAGTVDDAKNAYRDGLYKNFESVVKELLLLGEEPQKLAQKIASLQGKEMKSE